MISHHSVQFAQDIGSIMFFRNLGFTNTNDKQPNQIGACMFFLTGIQFPQNKAVNGHD